MTDGQLKGLSLQPAVLVPPARTEVNSQLTATRRKKYAGGRVQKEIKRLLKNSLQLLECMKKEKWGKSFEALCSHGLAKSTWGKYTAAVRLFKKFCREQAKNSNYRLARF